MYYIGIDLGTSSVKLLLCDNKGKEIKSVTKEYPSYYPYKGYSEQDPESWLEKTLEGLKELVKGNEKHIKAVSISGQMHGLVMLDENDNVIRRAILWNDSRSEEECIYLNSLDVTDHTGNIAFPGFTAPKILWVKKNEAENFSRCRKIMLPKDYIIYKLTGLFVSEPSDASGLLLYDVKNNCYSKEMLEICSLTEDMLPEIKPSFENIGFIKEDISNMLGIDKVIVAPGGGDNAMAAVGLGVIKEGMCSISLGTSGTVFIPSDKFSVDENNALHSFRHATGAFHLMGCILSAASCSKWWIEEILNSKDYSLMEEVTPDGENQVFYLPYMMGERSPHNDPSARGAFIGMSMDTKRSDMVKAVMEGVCYALRDCVEIARKSGIELTSARISGGGSRSDVWCTMLADILKMRIVRCENMQGPSLGAAIMAMVAAGEYDSVQEAACAVVAEKDIFEPVSTASEKYDKGYIRFGNLYKSLKDWYKNA